MKITCKDGSVREYAEAKSILEIAADISDGLARMACAGEVDGEIVVPFPARDSSDYRFLHR